MVRSGSAIGGPEGVGGVGETDEGVGMAEAVAWWGGSGG